MLCSCYDSCIITCVICRTRVHHLTYLLSTTYRHIISYILLAVQSRYPTDTDKTDTNMMALLKRMDERLSAAERQSASRSGKNTVLEDTDTTDTDTH